VRILGGWTAVRKRPSVLIAGLLMGLVVLGAGLVGIARRPNRFHAVAQMVVVPRGNASPQALADAAGLYARAYDDDALVRSSLRAAHLSDAEIARVHLSGQLLAGTAVVSIDAASSDPVLAENAANALVRDPPRITGLSAYETQISTDATGSAHRTGGGTGALLTVTLIMAVAAGIAASVVWRRIPRRL